MIYRIVGVFNLAFALPQVAIPLMLFLTTVPQLDKLYQDSFGISSVSLIVSYLAAVLLVLMGAVNLFLGLKLFSRSKQTERHYLKYALVSIFITLILAGWLMGVMLLSLILPLHQLSSV